MTKAISMAASIAIAILGLAAPAQAATRLMDSSFEGFQYRCEHHDGAFARDGAEVTCDTPTVSVTCEYFSGRQAMCTWPGIEDQIAVIRVIGTLPGSGVASAAGGDGGGTASLGGGTGGGGGGIGFLGPKDIKDAPDPDPKPNFDDPDNFQMSP